MMLFSLPPFVSSASFDAIIESKEFPDSLPLPDKLPLPPQAVITRLKPIKPVSKSLFLTSFFSCHLILRIIILYMMQ